MLYREGLGRRCQSVPPAPGPAGSPLISIRDLNLWYGKKQALETVSFDLYSGEVLAFIGPTEAIFTAPRTAECRNFIAGRTG